MAIRKIVFTLLGLAAYTSAYPVESSGSIVALSESRISSFKPFAYYASAAFCLPSTTLSWSCGEKCEANPQFEPVASGGNGGTVQYWYVGFDPALDSVIVVHQGTDSSKLLSIVTDVIIDQITLNSNLFPGVSSDIKVHQGFADEQAMTAPTILSAVQTALSRYNSNNVTLVGHSLGAAISLLDGVYLPLHLPGVTFHSVLFGLVRVGNEAFADYVDASAPSLTHINNKEDPLPIYPSMSLGYHQPSGEVHITDDDIWESCPGQDNANVLCTVGDVRGGLNGNFSDHFGPYDGVVMGLEC